MNDTPTKCRSCGADIFFIKYKGKLHPLNYKPRRVFISDEDEFGNTMSWEFVNGYESHFVTCPQAQKWRKDSGKNAGGVCGE